MFTKATFAVLVLTLTSSMAVAGTRGMDNRQDRRDDRQDCRQSEGLGQDKRDCKQSSR
jgi:hypothetical protein